jgi:hypothetical protein
MKLTTKNTLRPEERSRLAELEPVVKAGMANFVVVGKALLEIADSRLYRERYSTFKEYVEAEYDMSARHAYRLCEAATVVKSLPPNVTKLVTNENQARALGDVPSESRTKTLKQAAKDATAKGEKLGAAHITRAADKIAPKTKDEEAFKGLSLPSLSELLKQFETVLERAEAEIIPPDQLTPFCEIYERRLTNLWQKAKQQKARSAYVN